MFPLFETIAVEHSEPLLLQYHQQRMDDSFLRLFYQENPFQLSQLFRSQNISSKGLLKWKVEYDSQNIISSVVGYSPRMIQRVKFVEINPDFDYSMKFSNRDYFDMLKNENPGYDELILLKNGQLTDSTFSNIVLEAISDGKLYTPSAPLLKGTQRQYLLDTGSITPIPISIRQLTRFNKIYLINAMLPLPAAPCLIIGEETCFQ
jgi:4-amino-4-deoxychorismate lyase